MEGDFPSHLQEKETHYGFAKNVKILQISKMNLFEIGQKKKLKKKNSKLDNFKNGVTTEKTPEVKRRSGVN